MKLPYDPPTFLSDAVTGLVMLVVMLLAFAWIVAQMSKELSGSSNGRSGPGESPAVQGDQCRRRITGALPSITRNSLFPAVAMPALAGAEIALAYYAPRPDSMTRGV